MNHFALLFFILLSAGCTKNDQVEKNTDRVQPDRSAYASNPYRLDLQIEAVENNLFQLVAAIELDSGCYFVSPYSSDRYKGYFQIALDDNGYLQLDSTFVESPRSVPQPDRWEGGMSNFVEENTSYTYKLTVNGNTDFKVLGMVQFVIEPKCTLEEIPFSISKNDGKLRIQKYPKLDRTTCTKSK